MKLNNKLKGFTGEQMKTNLSLIAISSLFLYACFPCKIVELETNSRNYTVPGPKIDSLDIVKYTTPPELIGGYDFIRQHLKYPELARANCLQARVLLLAVINENGQTEKAESLVDDQGWGFNMAALDVLYKAKWKPAKFQDKPVKVRLTLPISFKLK